MDGGSLADVLHAAQITGSGPLSEMVLGKLAARTLAGLNYLHRERHQVHRDMKPGNILLNSRGEVKISDFGLSAELDSTKEMCATFIGTHAYMSPERLGGKPYSCVLPRVQTTSRCSAVALCSLLCAPCSVPARPTCRVACSRALAVPLLLTHPPNACHPPPALSTRVAHPPTRSFASDIWSLGITLVECALGQFPYTAYTGNNYFVLLSQILNDPPPQLPNEFSAEFRDFILQCLCKEPEQRPSAEQLLTQ